MCASCENADIDDAAVVTTRKRDDAAAVDGRVARAKYAPSRLRAPYNDEGHSARADSWAAHASRERVALGPPDLAASTANARAAPPLLPGCTSVTAGRTRACPVRQHSCATDDEGLLARLTFRFDVHSCRPLPWAAPATYVLSASVDGEEVLRWQPLRFSTFKKAHARIASECGDEFAPSELPVFPPDVPFAFAQDAPFCERRAGQLGVWLRALLAAPSAHNLSPLLTSRALRALLQAAALLALARQRARASSAVASAQHAGCAADALACSWHAERVAHGMRAPSDESRAALCREAACASPPAGGVAHSRTAAPAAYTCAELAERFFPWDQQLVARIELHVRVDTSRPCQWREPAFILAATLDGVGLAEWMPLRARAFEGLHDRIAREHTPRYAGARAFPAPCGWPFASAHDRAHCRARAQQLGAWLRGLVAPPSKMATRHPTKGCAAVRDFLRLVPLLALARRRLRFEFEAGATS
ncbi:hypothetical protein KFE25_002433 [Diacronema lutheri]|uniref:PX domain-containing protein n=1 Tax=Diacronema lutheri TaxID=2081491 RepID=A0A8J6C5P2_DIALT|nr:hypothetical protein KFE25_002433 [Diacronema lutheri]